MASTVTPSTLDGLFYEIYSDKIQNLVPNVAKFIKMVPFSPAEKELGKTYNQPLVMTNESGFTYALAGSGAFSLNSSVAFTMKNASVQGAQIVLRSTVAYDAASKASNSVKAFENEFDLQIRNMVESSRKRSEISYFYGSTGLGKTSVYAGVSATQATVTLSNYATGIWAGTQDAVINFYTSVGALVSSGADSQFVIAATNPTLSTITVNGTSTGITALAAAAGAGVLDIYFLGSKGNEMFGIDYLLTTTGTIFGIDNSIYSLWKGNTYSCSNGDLTMGKVLAGLAAPIGLGLEEDVVLFCNPVTWARLNTDLAALRRYDGSYKKDMGTNGVSGINYTSQAGDIKIISHSIIKPNEAFCFPLKRVKRIGSTDLTFKSFVNNQQMFRELSDNAGFELRNYSDQAVLIETPARCVKYTNIVNS